MVKACGLVNFYPNLEEGRANIPNSENNSIQDIQAGSKIVLSENNPNGVPSTQSTFKERDNIHPLKPYMGDVIHQGRFGNSIRFSSTASPINTEWSSTGKNGDPILILRNGQPLNNLPNNPWTPITENINEDPSSIYLTSYQSIPFTPSSENYRSFPSPPKSVQSYSNPQVIINSGRLVFNAKSDFMKDYDAAQILGISASELDDKMSRVSVRERNAIEQGEFRPYIPSSDIINKFEENALRLGVPNPYFEAEPIIDGIRNLIEIAPLSLESLPEIENPFRVDETQVNLDSIANLNTIGGQLTGGDLLAGVSIPNTGELPFDQLKNQDQKLQRISNVDSLIKTS